MRCPSSSPSMLRIMSLAMRPNEVNTEVQYDCKVDVYKRQMEYSTRIYQVYLKYIAPEDIVVYSIDEVFMLSLIHIF